MSAAHDLVSRCCSDFRTVFLVQTSRTSFKRQKAETAVFPPPFHNARKVEQVSGTPNMDCSLCLVASTLSLPQADGVSSARMDKSHTAAWAQKVRW